MLDAYTIEFEETDLLESRDDEEFVEWRRLVRMAAAASGWNVVETLLVRIKMEHVKRFGPTPSRATVALTFAACEAEGIFGLGG